MREHDLMEACRDADAAPEPPLAFLHSGDLLKAGRRRVRRRRAVLGGSLAVALVALAGASVFVRPDGPGDRARTVTPAAPGTPAHRPGPAPLGLTQWFTASLPAGLSMHSANFGAEACPGRDDCGSLPQSMSAQDRHRPGLATPRGLAVVLYARGRYPAEDAKVIATPAQPVAGHTAYTSTGAPHETCLRLRWEYQPQSWAEVQCDRSGDDRTSPGTTQPGDEALLRKVAESVQFKTEPVRTPFSLGNLPAEFTVTGSSWILEPDGSGVSSRIALHLPQRGHPDVDGGYLSAEVSSATYPGPTPNHKGGMEPAGSTVQLDWNTTVDGHPALWEKDSHGDWFLYVKRDGYLFTLSAGPQATPVIGGKDEFIRIYRSMKLVERPQDPSTWTGTPLR